jgi:hypothetical protein
VTLGAMNGTERLSELAEQVEVHASHITPRKSQLLGV